MNGPFSAIDNVVYEGMATVFERENARVLEPYGDYRKIPEKTLEQWLEEMRKISAVDFADEKVYAKWKFFHPELQESWIAYRTGAWLVDQVLKKQGLTIMDLKTKKASDVLNLYDG